MKKKLLLLSALMAMVIIISTIITLQIGTKKNEKDKLTIVTSFYPMYVLTANIVGDNQNIDIINLTNYTTGCLHDYQLTTTDMTRLEDADILVINGGGMESFMTDIFEAYPNLPIITASEGITYLLSEEHEHAHSHDHDHEGKEEHEEEEAHTEDEIHGHESDNHLEDLEYNAHVWMNMDYYIIEIQNVVEQLSALDPDNATSYKENGAKYQEKIEALKTDFEKVFAEINNTKDVVIFHDAFAYFAQEFSMNVVHTVNMDTETSLSAGEIAEIVEEVNEKQVQVLFTEEQYKTSIASNIADETGANVYVIDSLVTGDMDRDSYIKGMEYNLSVIKEAFGVSK